MTALSEYIDYFTRPVNELSQILEFWIRKVCSCNTGRKQFVPSHYYNFLANISCPINSKCYSNPYFCIIMRMYECSYASLFDFQMLYLSNVQAHRRLIYCFMSPKFYTIYTYVHCKYIGLRRRLKFDLRTYCNKMVQVSKL